MSSDVTGGTGLSSVGERPDSEFGPPSTHRYMSKIDMVTAALRSMITSGELRPGSLLRQRQLAEHFGVSPTPVREAIRRLEAEGIIVYDPHYSASVVEVDFGPTLENFRIRAALESLAASLAAAKATDEDLDEIDGILSLLRSCDPSDGELYRQLNREFHFRIYKASRSPLLFSIIRRLWDAFGGSPQPGPPLKRGRNESMQQHEELLAALRTRDPAKAEACARDHILTGVERTMPLRD